MTTAPSHCICMWSCGPIDPPNARTRTSTVTGAACANVKVNGKLWPLDRPGQSTQATALLQGRVAASGPQDRRADQWIKNFRANQYWVKEDSMLWANQSVLSLVWWEDESQLIHQENFEEESGSWRSDRKRDWD